MSLEINIQNLTNAVTKLTELLEDGVIPNFAKSKQTPSVIAEESEPEFADQQPAKERKKPGPKPKAKAPEAVSTTLPAEPYSLTTSSSKQFDEIVTIFKANIDEKEEILVGTLKEFKVVRASQLNPEQYGDFLVELRANLAASTIADTKVSLV